LGGGGGGNFDAASCKISRIIELVRIFKEASRNFKDYFETLKMQKYLKTIGAYTESTDLIFKVFKKNYSSRDTAPLKWQFNTLPYYWIMVFPEL
jgi:hypothetical protein